MTSPLQTTLTIHITENTLLNQLTVVTTHQVRGQDSEAQSSTCSIQADQLFARLQHLLDNQLRVVCSKMETQLKQNKGKNT